MESRIKYEVKGKDRKALVQAISDYLNAKPIYQGVPTFAYSIGPLSVDSEGTVIIDGTLAPEEVDRMLVALKAKGFIVTNHKEGEILEISMPRELFTERAIENLEKMLNAKGQLMAKAIGTEDLSLILEDTKVTFPWFPLTESSEEISHYTFFVEGLCKMAIESKRVISKAKESRIIYEEKY